MFKNLFIKSKKIVSLFTISNALLAFSYILSQDPIIKDKINGFSNEIPVENINDIEKEEGKIITKDYINTLNKNFNNKLNKDNKDIAIITIDSNIKKSSNNPKYIKDISHAKNVKGILDTITNAFKNYFNSLYLPYEQKDNGLQEIDYIESITHNIKNKIIFVNESFGKYINFNHKDSLTLDSLTNFNQQIFDIKVNNNNLLSLLKDNPNIALNKSAGNYIDSDNLSNRKKLIKMFNKLTNNDYKLTEELIPFLNKIIKTNIENNIIGDNNLINKYKIIKDENIEKKALNNNLIAFLDDFQELCKMKDINYDNFINLYIKDYLVHYQKLDLLEKLNSKENKEIFNERNNPFGLQQITIIEAIDLNTIKENVKVYKEYHKDIDISKLEKEIKDLNLNDYKNYSLEDINKLEILYNSYQDNYPEIFLFSSFGTLSNLMYKESNLLKTSIQGHNGIGLDSAIGTSFAAPNYLGNYVNKYIETYGKEIKNMFINHFDKHNFKINGLDD